MIFSQFVTFSDFFAKFLSKTCWNTWYIRRQTTDELIARVNEFVVSFKIALTFFLIKIDFSKREYDHLSYANRGHSALEKRDYSDLINILWRDVADGIDFSTQQSEKIPTTFF